MLTSRVYCISSGVNISHVAHPHDSYIAWVLLASRFYKRRNWATEKLHRHLRSHRCKWPNPAWTQAVCSSVCAPSLKAVSLTPCSCLRVLTYHWSRSYAFKIANAGFQESHMWASRYHWNSWETGGLFVNSVYFMILDSSQNSLSRSQSWAVISII